LFALIAGEVKFERYGKNKKKVSVYAADTVAAEAVVA
jgi:ribosomal protein L27